MEITFRTDATREVGAGHVMRCLALAEELKRRRVGIRWSGQIDVPWVHKLLESHGWPVQPPGSGHSIEGFEMTSDVVVVDSYTVAWRYRQKLLDRGVHVLAIVDDFHPQLGPGSLWVNPGAPMEVDWPSLGEFMNGPDFVLIREEVRALRRLRLARMGKSVVPTVTVLLGGTDFSGIGHYLEELARQLGPEVRLFAGPATSKARGPLVRWMGPGPELLGQAAQSDLVVSSAGVSSWELLHIGVPLALILATENQRGNYEWMTRRGLAWGLGHPATFPDENGLSDCVASFLSQSRIRTDARPESPVDGRGVERVADSIMRLS